jgi:hypothetical protein
MLVWNVIRLFQLIIMHLETTHDFCVISNKSDSIQSV